MVSVDTLFHDIVPLIGFLLLAHFFICLTKYELITKIRYSVFCGTDSEGDHMDPVKLPDNKYHIPGDLTCRSKSKIKKILDDLAGILPKEVAPRLIVMVPIPRYVTARCCDDPEHITNFEQESYVCDLTLTGKQTTQRIC
jgi:hypothetical protein